MYSNIPLNNLENMSLPGQNNPPAVNRMKKLKVKQSKKQ